MSSSEKGIPIAFASFGSIRLLWLASAFEKRGGFDAVPVACIFTLIPWFFSLFVAPPAPPPGPARVLLPAPPGLLLLGGPPPARGTPLSGRPQPPRRGGAGGPRGW